MKQAKNTEKTNTKTRKDNIPVGEKAANAGAFSADDLFWFAARHFGGIYGKLVREPDRPVVLGYGGLKL